MLGRVDISFDFSNIRRNGRWHQKDQLRNRTCRMLPWLLCHGIYPDQSVKFEVVRWLYQDISRVVSRVGGWLWHGYPLISVQCIFSC